MLAAMFTLTWTACDDEIKYTPAGAVEGAQVYFPTSVSSTINLSSTENSYQIPVMRVVTDAAMSVAVTATGGEGLYTVPSTVEFAQGEANAYLTLTYDPDVVGFDSFTDMTITLGSDTTPYGISTYEFSIGIPAPWVSLGNAKFSDTFLFDNTYDVELQQNELEPNRYRLVDPYSAGLKAEGYETQGDQSAYVEFTLLQPGDKINDVTITMDGLVYFPAYCTGFYNTSNGYNSNVDAHHPSDFTNYQDESYWTYSKVVQYEDDGTPGVVQLAPYYYMNGIGGWNYSLYDEIVTIVFPGFIIADYSVSLVYAGSYTDANGYNYALADVTLGADVEEVRLVLCGANEDPNAVVAGLADGSIEDYVSAKGSGEVRVKAAGNGSYQLVAVTFADGEAQEATVASFIHRAAAISPISDYVGQWMLTGVDYAAETPAQFRVPVTIAQVTEDSLTVSGAYPVAGFDDTFGLNYDKESGYVILQPQVVAPLMKGDTTLVVPFNMNESSFSTDETLTGQLDEEGNLLFGNTYGNEGNYDSFAYLLYTEEGASLVSYYSTYLTPYAMAAATQSFVSAGNAVQRMSGMKMQKVTETKKSVQPVAEHHLKVRYMNAAKERTVRTTAQPAAFIR